MRKIERVFFFPKQRNFLQKMTERWHGSLVNKKEYYGNIPSFRPLTLCQVSIRGWFLSGWFVTFLFDLGGANGKRTRGKRGGRHVPPPPQRPKLVKFGSKFIFYMEKFFMYWWKGGGLGRPCDLPHTNHMSYRCTIAKVLIGYEKKTY